MAFLTYNGVTIEEPFHTLLYSKDVKLDPSGTDYLYTVFRLHVRGIYNPESTVSGAGAPPTTDIAIRHALLTPRSTLIYSQHALNGQASVVFTSPSGATGVDAHNGPIPLALNVTQVIGTKSWVIEYAIETYINENTAATKSVLLSHRWRMEESIDQDYFTTRTITGRAIFRTDRLATLSAVPDDFRTYMAHPIPGGFRRESIHVAASEDGSELDYHLVDRQQASICIRFGVSRIEATHTAGVTVPGLERIVSAAIGDIAALGSALGKVGSAHDAPGTFRNSARAYSNLPSMQTWGNMPIRFDIVEVRVWGDPSSLRKVLTNVAMVVALGRFSEVQTTVATKNLTVMHDLMGKFVSVRLELMSGPLQTAAPIGAGGTPLVLNAFPDSDDLSQIAVSITSGAAQSPPPLGDNLSIGTYLARMAAQALSDPNDVPDTASEPAANRRLSPP